MNVQTHWIKKIKHVLSPAQEHRALLYVCVSNEVIKGIGTTPNVIKLQHAADLLWDTAASSNTHFNKMHLVAEKKRIW